MHTIRVNNIPDPVSTCIGRMSVDIPRYKHGMEVKHRRECYVTFLRSMLTKQDLINNPRAVHILRVLYGHCLEFVRVF